MTEQNTKDTISMITYYYVVDQSKDEGTKSGTVSNIIVINNVD